MSQTSPPPTPSAVERFFDQLRTVDVRRANDGRWVGGVCAGVATRLGVDPLLIRVLVIVLGFLGGFGIAAYLAAWVLLPDREGDIVAERGVRDGEVGPLILLAIAVLALLGPWAGVGNWGGGWFASVTVLVLTVGLVAWLVTRTRSSRAGEAPVGGPPPGAAAGAGTPAPPPPTWGAAPPAGRADAGPGAPAPAAALPPTPSTPGAAAPPPPGGPTGSGSPGRRPGPPPRPARRPVPRAGLLAALVVAGLALAAGGTLTLLHAGLGWSGNPQVVALAGALAVLGAATLAFGVAGLRSGLTGFLAAVLALVTWAAFVTPSVDWRGGFGERVWRPTTTTSQTYELGVGDATLDLRDYPADPASAADLAVEVGAGQVTLRVPSDLTVEVDGEVRAGTITVDGTNVAADGRDRSSATVRDTYGPGTPDVAVTLRLGAGDISITTEEPR